MDVLTVEHMRAAIHAGDTSNDWLILRSILCKLAGWPTEAVRARILPEAWAYLAGALDAPTLARWVGIMGASMDKGGAEVLMDGSGKPHHYYDVEKRAHQVAVVIHMLGASYIKVKYGDHDQDYPTIEELRAGLQDDLVRAIVKGSGCEVRAVPPKPASGARAV